jgi:hypothetical protein
MSAIISSFTPASAAADNAKAVGSHVAVIPAAGTAQVINPVDGFNSLTFMNVVGSNYVRATITFTVGVAGNATAATQVVLIPPSSAVSVDFSDNPKASADEIRVIDSISLVSVALPAASAEVSTLAALVALAGATVVMNFAHGG